MPETLVRRGRTVTLVAGPALVVVFVLGDATASFEAVAGGWTWQSVAFVAAESALTVFGPIWLLGLGRRHLDRPLPWGSALSRSAYAAFILQAPVLVGLALLVRDVPVAAEVKAVVVAGGGVVGSFAVAWLVVDRVPGLRRVL